MSWSFIPKIYVATIENSKRISSVTESLQRMGVKNYEFNYQIPPTVKNLKNITLSCTDNHLQIYKKAVEGNYSFVCIFEDDVFTTCTDIPKVLKNIKKFIETYDWDILYLGQFPWKIGKYIENDIYESISWCTHSYLINRKTMLKILNYSPEQIMTIGRIAVPTVYDMVFREGGGIDTFLAQLAYRNKIKSYCLHPMFIEQNSIPNWSLKSKVISYISRNEWWSLRLFYIIWILYWIILGLIIKSK